MIKKIIFTKIIKKKLLILKRCPVNCLCLFKCRKSLIFQIMNSVKSNYLRLKHQK